MIFKTQLHSFGFGRIERLAPQALRLAAAFNDVALASACGGTPFIGLAMALGVRMLETKKAQAVSFDQRNAGRPSRISGPAVHR